MYDTDDQEMIEVFRCANPMVAQTAIQEALGPAGIEASVHNRVSHAFPAPAALPGAYFIAVRKDQAAAAIEALSEAQRDGVLSLEDGEVAASADDPSR